MLSNAKGKEQSTDLKRKSFTTHSVNNSVVQLIKQCVTTCREDFYIKHRRKHTSHSKSPLFCYKNNNLVYIFLVVTHGGLFSKCIVSIEIL